MEDNEEREETYVPGIGTYQPSMVLSHDSMDVTNPDNVHEFTLKRVNFPQPEQLPKIQRHNLQTLVKTCFTFLYIFFNIAYKQGVWGIRTLVNRIWDWIIPPTLEEVQTLYIRDAQLENIREKWSKTQHMPSYVSQVQALT